MGVGIFLIMRNDILMIMEIKMDDFIIWKFIKNVVVKKEKDK